MELIDGKKVSSEIKDEIKLKVSKISSNRKPHLAAIYYVNDSDGFTFLFDDDNNIIEKIMPKKGSLLLFNGNKKHASGHPIKSLKRCVINFNLSND